MSAVEAIRAALPPMTQQKWGRILLVTSLSAKEPIPQLTLSNSLRPGLVGLANSLSKEVARDGITVNAIMPGYIDTERLADLGIDKRKLGESIPANRIGQPAELAALVAFLASVPDVLYQYRPTRMCHAGGRDGRAPAPAADGGGGETARAMVAAHRAGYLSFPAAHVTALAMMVRMCLSKYTPLVSWPTWK